MSSLDPSHSIAERNLIFTDLALERGWIQVHQINHAFTIWICNKNQHLGEILIEMGALTQEQKVELDAEVERKLSPNSASIYGLAKLDSQDDLEDALNLLDDPDLGRFLGRTGKFRKENLADMQQRPRNSDGSNFPPIPKDKPEQPLGEDTAGSDRFDPRDYLKSQGGMGELWRALDKELNRYVAVKYIKRFKADDPNIRGLFYLEGEVTGHLEHPNIPPVYSLGKDSLSREFYAMRFFNGKKLSEAIRDYHGISQHNPGERKERLLELLQAFQTACLTIQYAHTRGVIHCDIKPDNIMVGAYGETIVIDWGLVVIKAAGQMAEPDTETVTFDDAIASHFAPSKTASGGLHVKQGGSRRFVGGTLAYMSPEQFAASETGDINLIDFRSDVFALGATLYHIVVGRAPLMPNTKERESKSSFFERIRKAEYPGPRSINPGIARPLESIINKAMDAGPENRYASPRDLAEDIRRWLSDEPTKAHREGVAAKTGRWLRRNRKLVSVVSAAFLLSFLVGGILVYIEQKKTLRFATASKSLANNGFSMVEIFEPLLVSDMELNKERRKTLLESAELYKILLDELRLDEKGRLMAASILRFTANSQRFDYDFDRAIPSYKQAIQIIEASVDHDKEDFKRIGDLIRTKLDYGQIFVAKGEFSEAERITAESLALLEKTAAMAPTPESSQRLLASIKMALAGISHGQKQFEKSELEISDILTIVDVLKKSKKFKNYDVLRQSSALVLLGTIKRERNQLDQSLEKLKEARDLLAPYFEEAKEYDENIVRGISRMDLFHALAVCKLEQNHSKILAKVDLPNIETSQKAVIAQWEAMIKDNPGGLRYQIWLAKGKMCLGLYYRETGKLEEFRSECMQAKEICRKILIKNSAVYGAKEELVKIEAFLKK